MPGSSVYGEDGSSKGVGTVALPRHDKGVQAPITPPTTTLATGNDNDEAHACADSGVPHK